ncbi:MAG: hypothetical protein AMXMBFR12_04680 [Candidatus Babeliales bacterium]
MKKQILLILAIAITTHNLYSMRATCRARPPQAQHKFALQTPQMALSKSRALLNTWRTNPTRPYSGLGEAHDLSGAKSNFNEKNKASYEQAKAKQPATWLNMELRVSERVSELQAQARKHHDQTRQHGYYARTYETLAELEIEKHILFKHMVHKLTVAGENFEDPNLETEKKLMEILHKTYEEFHTALPKSTESSEK